MWLGLSSTAYRPQSMAGIPLPKSSTAAQAEDESTKETLLTLCLQEARAGSLNYMVPWFPKHPPE